MSLSVFISSNEAGGTKFPLKRAWINLVKSSGVEIIPPEEKAMSLFSFSLPSLNNLFIGNFNLLYSLNLTFNFQYLFLNLSNFFFSILATALVEP